MYNGKKTIMGVMILKKNRFYVFTAVWLALAALFLTASFKVMAEGEATAERTPEYASFEELNGKTISMLTGAPFEALISSKIPDVKEYTYYTSPSELLMALRTGKTDAFLNNTAIADLYVNQYDDVAHFPEPLKEAVFGCGFSKNYKNLPEWESALALGYTEKRAFRRIILPQARKIYFPLLKTQFSLLIKETSVVGYITVTDLTRAGDIIRGHTLEAFVPLLLIALIYFFLRACSESLHARLACIFPAIFCQNSR